MAASSERIAQVFKEYDVDGSGNLHAGELRNALADLGCSLTSEQVEKILSQADVDGNANIEFEEFSNLFQESRLRQTFDEIDLDGSGTIVAAELLVAIKQLDPDVSISESEVAGLLKMIDEDNDGHVDFEEFRAFFKYVPLANMDSILSYLCGPAGADVGSDLAPPLPPHSSVNLMVFLLGGAAGGIASRTFAAPLERVKMECQIKGVSPSTAISAIRQAQGFRGFYNGNLVNVLRVAPYAGSVCLGYNISMNIMSSQDTISPSMCRLLSGAFAGTFGMFLTYPLDIIRAHVTVAEGTSKGIMATARSIYLENGFRSLYRGLGTTLLTVAPFVGVQQSAYGSVKTFATSKNNGLGLSPSFLLFLVCGGLAGMAAQTVVYPLDMLRRRIQMSTEISTSEQNTSRGPWKLFKQTIKKDGVRSLYAGLLPSLAKTIPTVGVSIMVRDFVIGKLK